MKTWAVVLLFLAIDAIFMVATPYDYRKDYAVRLAPGGGLYIYLKYVAEKK